MKAFALIFVVCFSLILTGCPKASTIQKAADANSQIEGLTRTAISSTLDAMHAGLLKPAEAEAVETALAKIAGGGAAFTVELGHVQAMSLTQTVPQSKLAELAALFNTNLVAPFLDVLTQLKAVSPSQAQALMLVINSLRNALLVISAAFTQAGYHVTNITEVPNEAYA